MHVEALLCDAVSIREGLLHILGGGITKVHRRAYPTALGINLALRITIPRDSLGADHEVRVVVRPADDPERELGAVTLAFRSSGEPEPPPHAEVAFPAAVPLRDVPIPALGYYVVEIFGNDQLLRSLPFEATGVPQQPHPNS